MNTKEKVEQVIKFTIRRDKALTRLSKILIVAIILSIGCSIFYAIKGNVDWAMISLVVTACISELFGIVGLLYLFFANKKKHKYIRQFNYNDGKEYLAYLSENKGNALLLDIFAKGMLNIARDNNLRVFDNTDNDENKDDNRDENKDENKEKCEKKKMILMSFFKHTVSIKDSHVTRLPLFYLGLKPEKKNNNIDLYGPLKYLCTKYMAIWNESDRLKREDLIVKLRTEEKNILKYFKSEYKEYYENDTRTVMGDSEIGETFGKLAKDEKQEKKLKNLFLVSALVIIALQVIFNIDTEYDYIKDIIDNTATIWFEIITVVLLFIELQKDQEYLY